jgi:hypothetical protein
MTADNFGRAFYATKQYIKDDVFVNYPKHQSTSIHETERAGKNFQGKNVPAYFAATQVSISPTCYEQLLCQNPFAK